MKKLRLLGAICACITLLSTNVFAVDKFWICGNGSWDDVSCWNPTGQPLGGDVVFLTQSDSIDRTVTYANSIPNAEIGGLLIDSTGTGLMTYLHNQDNLFIGQFSSSLNDRIIVGLDGNGVFTQNGGTVQTLSPVGDLWLGVNSTANGTYTLNNGILDIEGFLFVGSGYSPNAGVGTFNVNGGQADASITFLGDRGTINITGGSFNGHELIADSGAVVNQSGGNVNFQLSGSYFGTYNLSGGSLDFNFPIFDGTVNHSGGVITGLTGIVVGAYTTTGATYNLSGSATLNTSLVVGSNANGTFNQSGGTIFAPQVNISQILFGTNNAGNGTYNLSNGNLSAQNVIVGYDGAGTFNQTGGVSTITNAMTIGEVSGSSGTYNFDGGTLSVGSIVNGLGTSAFNFTGGTLNLTNGTLTIGSGGLLGDTLQLTSSQIINVTLDTVINSDGLLVVNNSALTSTNYTNNGEILLTSPIARLKGNYLDNVGLVRGEGRIETTLTNLASGEIRAQAGERLLFTGTGNTNSGSLNLIGGTAEFTQDLTNNSSGFIAGRGTLIASGGLTNEGNIGLSSGNTDIFGDVNNANSGAIIVSGSGTATFYDDVVHNGAEIRVSNGSSAVFFGAVSGAGSYTGTGSLFFEGDLNPGNSPALVNASGDMSLGISAHTFMEVAGLERGTDYDAFDIGGDLSLGGVLEVSLYDPGSGLFDPQLGDSFDLFLAETISGSFDLLMLATLSGGLGWQLDVLTDAIGLTDVVRLSVVTSAVPVPPAVWLFGTGLLALLGIARRRQAA